MNLLSNKKIDASGLLCPEPIMMLHGAVRDAIKGEIIEVIATDPSTKKDIVNFCEFLGHGLIKSIENDGVYTFYVKKGG